MEIIQPEPKENCNNPRIPSKCRQNGDLSLLNSPSTTLFLHGKYTQHRTLVTDSMTLGIYTDDGTQESLLIALYPFQSSSLQHH